MSFHFIAIFEPVQGKKRLFSDELLRVVDATRREPGCVKIQIFETADLPVRFAVHSEWVSESSFDMHVSLPHTERFLQAGSALLTQPIQGLRCRTVGQ
jgi:quinol monooxygenase YgiN